VYGHRGNRGCPDCNGWIWFLLRRDGKCKMCCGSGINVHVSSTEPKCDNCKGTGICPTCGGTGTINYQRFVEWSKNKEGLW
jgi:DnaJ-class molecular chaperone